MNLDDEEGNEKLNIAPEKAKWLIEKMKQFSSECSIKYVKRPQRLNLKFEKSFTMAIKKNKTDVLPYFPKYSIKTVYVSMHQLKDYKQYKEDKDRLKEMLTTPLHLACQKSNLDAVRFLVERHGYDINVLVNDKNFLYELLCNSGYMDFSIMQMIFKRKKPQINSGSKLALNQAILRGNPFMINTLLEHGDPNPYTRDSLGKSPLHMAA
jgi:ankyrin repeat protein